MCDAAAHPQPYTFCRDDEDACETIEELVEKKLGQPIKSRAAGGKTTSEVLLKRPLTPPS